MLLTPKIVQKIPEIFDFNPQDSSTAATKNVINIIAHVPKIKNRAPVCQKATLLNISFNERAGSLVELFEFATKLSFKFLKDKSEIRRIKKAKKDQLILHGSLNKESTKGTTMPLAITAKPIPATTMPVAFPLILAGTI